MRETDRRMRQEERDRARYEKGMADYRREQALSVYDSYSLAELRSEAQDYGIADHRRDWKKMSRGQLAEWLMEHHTSAQRTYYEW